MNTSASSPNSQDKTLKVHPLAIIGISDHYTRVSTGGSVLPPTSACIGLLFGQTESNALSNVHNTLTIIDAEEVETSSDHSLTPLQMSNIKTKIELHQKVFPQHQVVGWYKITQHEQQQSNNGNGEDVDILPNPQDVKIHNGWIREFNPQPIFLLMNSSAKKVYKSKSGNTEGEDAMEKLERDEELPLALYEIMSTSTTCSGGGGSAFINMDFELETFGPERIAVETVFRTKPKVLHASNSNKNDGASSNAENSKVKATSDASKATLQAKTTATDPQTPPPTEAELHLQSIIKSVDAMNARVAILLDFLNKTKEGVIEPNHELLRQVMTLVKQLPLVMGRNVLDERGDGGGDGDGDGAVIASISTNTNDRVQEIGSEFQDQYDDMLVMSYLAALAKTTKAVVGYSEKFRFLEDRASSDKRSYGRHSRGSRGDVRMDE